MQAVARLGEPQAAGRAADKCDAANILEPSDSLTYGRACDAEAISGPPGNSLLRRPPETPALGLDRLSLSRPANQLR